MVLVFGTMLLFVVLFLLRTDYQCVLGQLLEEAFLDGAVDVEVQGMCVGEEQGEAQPACY